MASLQARHTRTCATAKAWTPFLTATEGCTCTGGPTYYVVVREGKKNNRDRVGKNRQQAERALRKIGTQVDEGEYQPQRRIIFDTWATGWLEGLERKPNTVRGYEATMDYARRAFGPKVVRRLAVDDVKRFTTLLREEGLADSTRAKHLRVLGTCLQSAIASGYSVRNPVRELPKGERPRRTRKEAAYFENDELPRLFAELEDGIYRTLCLVALKTGTREGELLALTWGDVDLTGGVFRVRRTYTDGNLAAPKNHEQRDVDLTGDVVELLGRWWGELGSPHNGQLVFPGDSASGYLVPTTILRRELYPAMEQAGVPRVGPTGEKRTFHSLRHTFAKRALENGRQITWLSRHLGHSSLSVTTEVYGHWERAERKREAELMEGVFGV
jgi:integrase